MQTMLMVQNQVKIYHWTTESYSVHKALDQLYSKLQHSIDKLIETYLSMDKTPIAKTTFNIKFNTHVDEVLQFLQRVYKKFSKLQEDLEGYPDLQAIVQEMLSDVKTAIYICRME